MVCESKTNTLSPSEPLEVNLAPEERLRLRAAMVVAGVALKKLRIKKLSRDSHQRTYRRWGHIIRLKVRDFARSEHGKKWAKEYQARRRRENPQVRFLNWLRGSINRDLRRQSAKKGGRTESLIGCTFDELRRHIEAQFTNGFSWENRSEWDVDHFIPVTAFDLTDPEEQRWAFNYRNMRPMGRTPNRSKSDTIPSPLPPWLPAHIAQRILARQVITASTSS